MIRLLALLLMFALVASSSQAQQSPRRVYVLHSGMHILLAPLDKNRAVKTLRTELLKRGVADSDIVPLDCPFPTATFADPVPRAGLLLYLNSADPKSRVAQDAYVRFHTALHKRNIGAGDRLVWIGHSAGGQIGMTMAHLAHHLRKFPELSRKAQAYRFDSVITLGSAVGANLVPAEVKLRHYHSPADTMISILSKHGEIVSAAAGIPFRFAPYHDLKANAKVRVFRGIEHGNWNSDPRVLACILREFEPDDRPFWRRRHADIASRLGLSQLFAASLEGGWRISVEEP